MTIKQLQNDLCSMSDAAEWESYIKCNLADIRLLFYGLTPSGMQANRFVYEDVIYSIVQEEVINRRDPAITPGITALLVFFMAYGERARLWQVIQEVSALMPAGSLRIKAETIYLFKYITEAESQYEKILHPVLAGLNALWETGDAAEKRICVALFNEYILDAAVYSKREGSTLLSRLASRITSQEVRQKYQLLQEYDLAHIRTASEDELENLRMSERRCVIESLHDEACMLLPADGSSESDVSEEEPRESPAQNYSRMPAEIDDAIRRMGGRHEQLRDAVKTNWNATAEQNQIYLGTYLPRTVIETWNILSELLAQREIRESFLAKEKIRIYDIGSGTGGAVLGALLALRDAGLSRTSVTVESLDANSDALMKQRQLMESVRPMWPFELHHQTVTVMLPQSTEQYESRLAATVGGRSQSYDIVLCWKYLCEFYNKSYLMAQGIIGSTLDVVSHILAPHSMFIIADVTTKDNNREWFPVVLNREAQQYTQNADSTMRTILPIPCARKQETCTERCFSQRSFTVTHALSIGDVTRIAYRVFSPRPYADRIINNYHDHPVYRVNARAPEKCCIVDYASPPAAPVCGYTSM